MLVQLREKKFLSHGLVLLQMNTPVPPRVTVHLLESLHLFNYVYMYVRLCPHRCIHTSLKVWKTGVKKPQIHGYMVRVDSCIIQIPSRNDFVA